jgi:hypothetical protein
VEAVFPLNDVLPMEKRPWRKRLLSNFLLATEAVLFLPRGMMKLDSWMKEEAKESKLIDGPKQVSTIKFTIEMIKRNLNRRA